MITSIPFPHTQVPNFVANKWKAACEKAMNEDTDPIGPQIGTICMTKSDKTDKPPSEYTLRLEDTAEFADVPREYNMNITTKDTVPIVGFSQKGVRLSGEGTVYQKFDVEMIRKPATDGSGVPQALDPAYRALNRERTKAAAIKTRTVQLVTDHKITNTRQPVEIGFGNHKKRQTGGEKRVARPAEEVQSELFTMFERQPRWAFPQLQKETDQPAMHLKSVLSEIAVQNRRGPYAQLWELKAQYKNSNGGGGAV